MNTEIIVAVIAFLGTVIGSLTGIVVSSKLTEFRLRQLEEKVNVHNHFAMRLPVVESKIEGLSYRLKQIEQGPNQKQNTTS